MRFEVRPWLRILPGLALVCMATPALTANASELPSNLRANVDLAVGRVKPALVQILVVSTSYADGREIKSQAVGSGAIITPEGHLISNHHVAGRAVRIVCTLADREEMEAELIGSDPLTDICIIQLKPAQPRQFPTASFGDSGALRVGDSVLAMGSPMALSQSVTLGIVSNTEMITPRFYGPMGRLKQEGEDVGSLVRWIGHDAQIYGGNSGGPLVNLRGEIIGINEIRMGLSGAIPGNLARSVAEQLIHEGRARRAWLGMEVQPLLKGSTADRGVLVSSVWDDSPAQAAGVRSGDRLLRVGDVDVTVRHEEELPAFMGLVSGLPVGKKTALTVSRDGQEKRLELMPTEREELRPRQQELRSWGITARNLSGLIARELKRPTGEGVLVTTVRPGGPAGEAKPQLQPQDVIVQVGPTPTRSLRELVDLTDTLTKDKKERVAVLVTFERKDRRQVAVVRLGLQETRDPGLEATKAWLPVETQVIARDIAAQLGRKDLKGYYITRVYPETTAARAGLRPGDLIVAVEDEKLTADAPENEDDLAALIRQYDPGTKVKLALVRAGKPVTTEVELARAPRLQREMKKYRNEDFEFSCRDVSFYDRAEEQWPADRDGVLVEDVKSGSWAELGLLYSGDLILEADSRPVRSVDDLRPVMEQVASARKPVVVLKVLRGIHSKYIELEPKWSR